MRDWRLSEDPWTTLGRYNAEVARGLMHTEEWRAAMAGLQWQFDEEQRARLIAEGMTEVGDGVWMKATAFPTHWWHRFTGRGGQ